MTRDERGANEKKFMFTPQEKLHRTDDVNDVIGSIWTDSNGHLFWVNKITPVGIDWIVSGTISDCATDCTSEYDRRHEGQKHETNATSADLLRGRFHGWLRLSAIDEQIYHLQPGQEVRIVITGIVEEPRYYGRDDEYPAVVVVSGDDKDGSMRDRTVLRFTGKKHQAGPTLRGVESVLPMYQIQELP